MHPYFWFPPSLYICPFALPSLPAFLLGKASCKVCVYKVLFFYVLYSLSSSNAKRKRTQEKRKKKEVKVLCSAVYPARQHGYGKQGNNLPGRGCFAFCVSVPSPVPRLPLEMTVILFPERSNYYPSVRPGVRPSMGCDAACHCSMASIEIYKKRILEQSKAKKNPVHIPCGDPLLY
ncbi:hypothetical protein F5B20DRAFT_7841 [Whalleya microplaca]|nr:hypothetical protein F5B20DRAFT_7841 [Whalleya microplaca]